MSLEIVRGNVRNANASDELIRALKGIEIDELEELLYLAYPISTSNDGNNVVDAVLLSERYGFVAFIFSNADSETGQLKEDQDALFFQLSNMLMRSVSLRKGRNLAVEPVIISLMPKGYSSKCPSNDDTYLFASVESLKKCLHEIPVKFDRSYYPALVENVQRISSIKPKKKRAKAVSEHSKGTAIKKIEAEIANLDSWQSKAALEFVDGPQRIRGLAGSGKTIVLALKAAYLHSQNPDWHIAITYYTRSLFQQFRDLVSKFCLEINDEEPDWEHLHIFHSWGSSSEEGLYSTVAHSVGVVPLNYSNARAQYGRSNPFSGICHDLINYLDPQGEDLYDAVLIDEAQDLPASFFQLVYRIVKHPKRIVWAYDELQNLSNSMMPSLEEMFGCDEDGKCVVSIRNEEGKPKADIVLPVCYRNPPWTLALAHALGFGIYHLPLIQHFENPGLWEEIGYEVTEGKLDFGSNVVLKRSRESAPPYFEQLLDPEEAIVFKRFETRLEQYAWIAESIKADILDEELDPDDILVVFPNALEAKSDYLQFSSFLNTCDIDSFLAGVTGSRNIFKQSDMVCCSSIYRAKGNEAPMVYIANADYCFEGIELIKIRNILFTAATRSRAWVRFCGVGDSMGGLIEEYRKIEKKQFALSFRIPTAKEMEQLLTVHRDRSETEVRQIDNAKHSINLLIELLKKGEIEPYQIPEIKKLATIFSADMLLDLDEED